MEKRIALLMTLTLVSFCKKPEAPPPAPEVAKSAPAEKIPDVDYEGNAFALSDTVYRDEPVESSAAVCCKKEADDTSVDPKCQEGYTTILKKGQVFPMDGRTEKKIKSSQGETYWYRMHSEGAGSNCLNGRPWVPADAVRLE